MFKNITASLLLSISSLAFASDPILPDSQITPGATLNITLAQLCVSGYTSTVRNVPPKIRKLVFSQYGIVNVPHRYEVDHLISLELGGSNDIKNLWPQSYLGDTNARHKDALEDRLRSLVCKKKVTLQEAQTLISTDWISAYKKYVSPEFKINVGSGK